jgi:lipoic acid synthetase
VLRIRYLGLTEYQDCWQIQKSIAKSDADNYLILCQHKDIYTLGKHAELTNIKDPSIYPLCLKVDRGGDVTFHGPGQLVGYPIIKLNSRYLDVRKHVNNMENMIIELLKQYEIDGYCLSEFPGVWVNREHPKKVCAIGTKFSSNRTYHGFALNVTTDLSRFEKIIPCGIKDKGVTSLAELGLDVKVEDLIEPISEIAAKYWGDDAFELQKKCLENPLKSVGPNKTSTNLARRFLIRGVDLQSGFAYRNSKPAFAKKYIKFSNDLLSTKSVIESNELNTVCKEAKCPNLSECWAESTATFLINGDLCTRACSFCDVKTAKGFPIDETEPIRVVNAARSLGLKHVVLTAPARDDLADGGAGNFKNCIEALRQNIENVTVEVLVPDFKGNYESIKTVFSAVPDVFNHNLETVLRLQKAVRPSASYERSLALLARAKDEGLLTKSGLIAGMGETDEEIYGTLSDLGAVGVSIVTIGQYLRPSRKHAPVMRYIEPEIFKKYKAIGESFGIKHVEASAFTRSSYRAGHSLEQLRQSVGGFRH